MSVKLQDTSYVFACLHSTVAKNTTVFITCFSFHLFICLKISQTEKNKTVRSIPKVDLF